MSFEYLQARSAEIGHLTDVTPKLATSIDTTSSPVTLTAAQIKGGIISAGNQGLSCTFTLPSSSSLYTTLNPLRVNQAFNVYLATAIAITFVAGDGYTTLAGNGGGAGSRYCVLVFNGIVSSNPTWTFYC